MYLSHEDQQLFCGILHILMKYKRNLNLRKVTSAL
jgi:hypothetical protein